MSKESRQAKKEQRQQLKKLPLRERMAAARRLAEGIDAELPDEPVTRERFRVDVEENIDLAGFGTTGLAKYRYTITDTATNRIQKTEYQFSKGLAQSVANTYVTKILSGKHAIK